MQVFGDFSHQQVFVLGFFHLF